PSNPTRKPTDVVGNETGGRTKAREVERRRPINLSELTEREAAVPLRTETTGGGKTKRKHRPEFPNRASWLKERLRERSWNKHDLLRHGGPDNKTVQKILNSLPVRADILEKLADALSKHKGTVAVLEIPQD